MAAGAGAGAGAGAAYPATGAAFPLEGVVAAADDGLDTEAEVDAGAGVGAYPL